MVVGGRIFMGLLSILGFRRNLSQFDLSVSKSRVRQATRKKRKEVKDACQDRQL